MESRLSTGAGGAGGPAGEPDRLGAREMLLQFIVIPLVLAGLCSATFLGVNWMTARDKSPEDFAQDLRSPDRRTRWVAAHEVARRNLKDPFLVPVLIELLGERSLDAELPWSPIDALKPSGQERSEIRWFAAQALGRQNDPRAVAPLREALSDADAGLRTHAALALGELSAREAAGDLARVLLSDGDAGVRKAAAAALGAAGGEGAREPLKKALADADIQVRWNAALPLARFADEAAVPVIAEMLDRARVAALQVPAAGGALRSVSEGEIQRILAAAILAADRLAPAHFAKAIQALESDPDLAVQTLAKKVRVERFKVLSKPVN